MERIVFHVDIDAFYASVEQHDNPDLAGKPVVVGAAPGHRGVVSACSYEARDYGIHSAMPISEAYSRCPQGVFLPVRMGRYQEVSKAVMSLLSSFSPDLQQISVDEAFLDMTGTRRLLGEPEAVAQRIKERVRDEAGLTISVGIGPNRYLAKLASEFGKPDGLFRVFPGQEIEFLDRLELKDLWGVGTSTLHRLRAQGITTVPALREHTRGQLSASMGNAAGGYLYRICRGRDPGIFSPEPRSRSVSSEATFGQDTTDAEEIHRTLLGLAQQLVQRMIDEGLQSRVVRLKLRFSDFTTTTAQRASDRPITSATEMMRIVQDLLSSRWDGFAPMRLVGLGFCDVAGEEGIQGELFDDHGKRSARVERTVSGIRSRIGHGVITKASLLGRKPRR